MIANEVKPKDVGKIVLSNHNKKHNKEPAIRIFLRCAVYLNAWHITSFKLTKRQK